MLELEEHFMIRKMHDEGLNISEIAKKTGHCRKIVRKYVQAKKPKEYKQRPPKERLLEPYDDYIQARLDKYPLSAVRVLEEIQEKGYTGSYTTVKNFVRPIKRSKGMPAEYRYETKPGIQSQVD